MSDTTTPGRVHLIGGGRDEEALRPLVADFISAARLARGGAAAPTIDLLIVREPEDDESLLRFRRLLTTAGAAVNTHVVLEGEVFAESAVEADGIFVAGGLTPAYATAVRPLMDVIRSRVRGGIPYLGFSAGAAVAAERAIVGGSRVADVEVCDPDAAEELEEVTVVEALGLVPHSIDVHAAQWGTLARAIAAVRAGLADACVAVDECTAFVTRAGDPHLSGRVAGKGTAWIITPTTSDAADVNVRLVSGEPSSDPRHDIASPM